MNVGVPSSSAAAAAAASLINKCDAICLYMADLQQNMILK